MLRQPSTRSAGGPFLTREEFAARTAEAFAERFGEPPRWIAAAPGRVNLIGEHTDYNGGYVLPMAIERTTVVAAGPVDMPHVRLVSSAVARADTFATDAPVTRGHQAWANYVRGVFAGFQRLGASVPGLNVYVDSDLPLGGGLSSSAALEVASATLLEAVTGCALPPVEKALLCQRAEHEYAGVPCGIMDQFTSVLAREGHLLLVDCRARSWRWVPLSDPSVAVMIVDTRVRHELADGEYARRRRECEEAAAALAVASLRDASLGDLAAARGRLDETAFRRARHVVSEIERTVQAAEAFGASRWPEAGRLMFASHASLRDDFEVSCRELDCVVEIAQGIGEAGGVFGFRMTGGGFGGCAVGLVRDGAVPAVSAALREGYRRDTGTEPSIFVSRPAAGAAILRPHA